MIAAAIGTAGLVVIWWSAAWRITPMFIYYLLMFPPLIGDVALDQRSDTHTADALAAGLLAIGCGYALSQRRSRHGAPQDHAVPAQAGSWRGVGRLVVLAAGLSIYHFAKVGVPLLASNVEIDRWNFAGSGLYGVPGRMLLFALPLLAGVAVVGRSRFIRSGTFWAAGAAFAASRLLFGFRHGLLEVVVDLGVAWTAASGGVTTQRFARRVVLPVALAAVFAIQLTASYGTSAGVSLGGRVQEIETRATSEAAIPGWLVLQGKRVLPERPKSILKNDGQYFFNEYVRRSADPGVAFDRSVSAAVLGVPTTRIAMTKWLVPVTVGGLPEFYWEFGFAGMLILAAMVGLLFAASERVLLRAKSAASSLCALTLLFGLGDYLRKGALVYVVVNMGAVLLMLLIARGVAEVCDRIVLVNSEPREDAFRTSRQLDIQPTSRVPQIRPRAVPR